MSSNPSTSVPPAPSASGYRPLEADTVADYIRSRPSLSALVGDGPLSVREVGDGNLNLVFVVRARADEPGLVLKQSLPWVRVHGESWPLTIERAAREAYAYETYARFAAPSIPAYHGFDREQYVVAMEDLADLRVWRAALNDGEVHAASARALGAFVARVAFHTSDFGRPAEEKKRAQAEAANPELCRITEDLVLTEPYIEHEHNWYPPALEPLVHEVRADPALHTAVANLKYRFLTHGEALIHGDLHTGSVMVGGGRTVAIDPEFAFYGPVGFDLGAIWANAAIAFARADRLARPAPFRDHVATIVPESWEAFVTELRRLWPQRVDRFLDDAFLAGYLDKVWRDAVGFAGAKAMRRMIGYAHVSDIETLDEPLRSSAAAAVVRTARRLIVEAGRLDDPAQMWAVVAAEVARG